MKPRRAACCVSWPWCCEQTCVARPGCRRAGVVDGIELRRGSWPSETEQKRSRRGRIGGLGQAVNLSAQPSAVPSTVPPLGSHSIYCLRSSVHIYCGGVQGRHSSKYAGCLPPASVSFDRQSADGAVVLGVGLAVAANQHPQGSCLPRRAEKNQEAHLLCSHAQQAAGTALAAPEASHPPAPFASAAPGGGSREPPLSSAQPCILYQDQTASAAPPSAAALVCSASGGTPGT